MGARKLTARRVVDGFDRHVSEQMILADGRVVHETVNGTEARRHIFDVSFDLCRIGSVEFGKFKGIGVFAGELSYGIGLLPGKSADEASAAQAMLDQNQTESA